MRGEIVARVPVCSLTSFIIKSLKECCGIVPGNPGSGSIYWCSSRTKEQRGSVGIFADNDGITLSYNWTPANGNVIACKERLLWKWVQVNYGKWPYLACPICERRCSRIAFRRGRWTCKRCAGACSDTENDQKQYRLMSRYQKIREKRLLWEPGESWGKKPKGMRWKTFDELVQKARKFENECWGEANRRYGDISV
jgi:hypothetical protein